MSVAKTEVLKKTIRLLSTVFLVKTGNYHQRSNEGGLQQYNLDYWHPPEEYFYLARLTTQIGKSPGYE